MFLSDFLRSNSLLGVAAAAGAINGGDTIQLNLVAQAARVVCSDYAVVNAPGGTPFPQVQYSASGRGAGTTSNRRALYFDTATGNIFVFGMNGANHPMVWKFGPTGDALASLQLSANNIAALDDKFALARLSNGDLVAYWTDSAHQPTFAIMDVDLYALKFGPTAVGAAGNNPPPQLNVCALSGGGFVMTWTNAGAGVYYAINTNVGGVTCAPTIIGGAGTQNSGTGAGASTTPAQLTSGNIAIALADSNLNTLGSIVISPAGGVIRGYATVGACSAGTTGTYPEVSVLPSGYWAMTTGQNSGASQQLAVFNDAGALQGVAYNTGATATSNALTNDGTSFWLASYLASADLQIARVGITGGASAVLTGGFAATVGASPIQGLRYDADFGTLVTATEGSYAAVFTIRATGKVLLLGTRTLLAAGHTDCFMEVVGDGCCLFAADGYLQVSKVQATSILGVAATSVAAGNAGTVVQFNPGAGGFPCTPYRGRAGIAFDHSAVNPIGNKGTFVTGRSISLKGI